MSQTFGSNQGQWQGVNQYNIDCGDNYINEITSKSLGSFIRAIGGKCLNGKEYGPYGGPEQTNKFTRFHSNKCDNGFNGMEVIHDTGIYEIAPICNGNKLEPIGKPNLPIGNKSQFVCPDGQIIKNISGIYDPNNQGYIGSMKLICGLPNKSIETFHGDRAFNLKNKLVLFIIFLILVSVMVYFYMKH